MSATKKPDEDVKTQGKAEKLSPEAQLEALLSDRNSTRQQAVLPEHRTRDALEVIADELTQIRVYLTNKG